MHVSHHDSRNNLIAFCVTVFAIFALAVTAAVICVMINPSDKLAQIVAAMGFIGSGITGLIAVAGGFRFGTAKPLVDNSTNTENPTNG